MGRVPQALRRLPGGGGVLALLHRRKDGGEAVALPGVPGGGPKEGGLLRKARPGPEGEADQPLPPGRDARPEEHAVRLFLRRRGKGQGRVRRQLDFRPVHPHGFQFLQGVRLPEGNHVHVPVQHLGRQLPVVLPLDGADAAAVHLDLAARPFGGADVHEVEPEGAAGGHVLDKASAAVDIEPCLFHGPQPAGKVHPADGADPVGKAGGLGIFGDNRHGHVRVDGPHLFQDRLQNRVVPGVAPAIGPADHHAVPLPPGPGVAAEDFPVDMELGVHGLFNGELGGGLFKELLPHLPPQGPVGSQGRQALAQGHEVPGGEQIAVDPVVNEVGDAPHGGGDGGEVEPGPLRQGVGKSLGQAGEDVDVQGAVEAVHAAADPPGEGDLPLHPQFPGKSPQLLPLLAVSGDY